MLKEIAERRSVRAYQDRKVEREKLLEVLESGRRAPSGHNFQPWIFLVIEDAETKEALIEADHQQQWMRTAPVLIAGIADLECRKEKAIRDTAIAMEHMVLEAKAQGLDTCWTGWYEQEEVKRILEIPENKYVCGILTLGYGAEKPEERSRKSLEEIVRFGKWNTSENAGLKGGE